MEATHLYLEVQGSYNQAKTVFITQKSLANSTEEAYKWLITTVIVWLWLLESSK